MRRAESSADGLIPSGTYYDLYKYYSIEQAQATQARLMQQSGHKRVMIEFCESSECRL